MSTRFTILIAFSAVFIASSSQVQGQAAPAAASSNAVTLTDLRNELRSAISGLATRDEVSAAIKNVADPLHELEAEVRRLREEVVQDKALINDQIATQRRMLEAISQPDSRGNPILALSNIMRVSPDFRRELGAAVESTLPRWGKLVIKNRMRTAQEILVDGRRMTIPANGDPVVVDVPAGSATTELIGYEAEKTWTIAPPSYEQTIVIAPAEPQVNILPWGPLVAVRR